MKYLLLFLMLPIFSAAETKLPQFFSDGMVLQQRSEVYIWGTDNPGTVVNVTTSWNKKSSAKVDLDGKWKLKITTPAAGGPYSLNVTGSSNVTLKDVLIGEVWLCSGQSNMERTMAGKKNEPVEGSSESIKNSDNDQIRVFTVAKNSSESPITDVKGNWLAANPVNTGKFSAVAYNYAKKLQATLKVPVGLIVSSWGGSSIEAWMDQSLVSQYPSIKTVANSVPNRTPKLLFNAMINPLIGYAIKGTIWYQGEANVGNASEYASYFGSMIKSWRKNWAQGDLPFYFVQIAPFNYGKLQAGLLRDAQLRVMKKVLNTGMAVTLDVGLCNLIHPPKKREVGERLALWALAKTYAQKGIVNSGPVYKSFSQIDGNQIALNFDYADGGLRITDGDKSGFEIAGADKVFHPANAKLTKDNKITVWSEMVPQPVSVRYAYGNCSEATLFNTAGLPAGTFRTDNW